MSEHGESHEQADEHVSPDDVTPSHETLPPESEPEGATQTKKPYSDFESEKAGKGGDHPTPGAGEHDRPH
jgi:hypothetical protein